MSKFPERLTVGPRNYQTTYELVPDQVLIKVSEDADEEELSTFLRTGSLETATVPQYVQRARRTLGKLVCVGLRCRQETMKHLRVPGFHWRNVPILRRFGQSTSRAAGVRRLLPLLCLKR